MSTGASAGLWLFETHVEMRGTLWLSLGRGVVTLRGINTFPEFVLLQTALVILRVDWYRLGCVCLLLHTPACPSLSGVW